MEQRELLIFEELYKKFKEENEDQIYIVKKQIDKLQNEIERRKKKDFVEEIYDEFRVYENGISLNEFKIMLYTGKNQFNKAI